MAEVMLKTENLGISFGGLKAVQNLNLEIKKGQLYGLVGPNGAGKSTTMNMLTGYLAPTKGTISMKGIDMLKAPDKAKENIGYLPEIPSFWAACPLYAVA